MKNQEVILGIIVNSGNARSNSMKAIKLAKNGQIEEAKCALHDAVECLSEAHKVQTSLIKDEANGSAIELSLLMIHAQDHLMNAMTIKDLATEIVDIHAKLN
ncbi:PTS lactose/cellobiose transporter subunit IIA [Clostridium sp. NSJ-6]|uniref:PTS lactose/cellobiose transporter subunit IIA n=1 Tax=Clostridium hominis TaxID=2763036 RepID=A0ABR7DDD1_9CLOT|nr:PTS lactose/cellobiose transporter subunit IIA [Clostridium hominis]MBC5629157.1 PTS lactose/cellobiose transporter subunit IIA [Clostridium hominis]MDU2671783.1 PTS lactose/cellobiose transporter subunit IIA [Clostridium sp.]